MAIVGTAVMTIVMIVLSAIVNGYVFSQLWAWFVVATFGLTAITIPQAIGLAMVVGWFKTGLKQDDSLDEYKGFNKLVAMFIAQVFTAIITLIVASIVKSFI